jgi:hypothetical protein
MKKQETKTAIKEVILEGVIFGITTALGLTIIASLLIAFINLIN